jgi:macrodomain Ter protein organizer (MatP/YcbG family)
MPQEGTGEGNVTGAGTGEKPAWVAQLPADLRDNPSFTSYKTIGELAKTHLSMTEKAKEAESLKAKLSDSIPKLTEDATDEEKADYYNRLGRPEKADGYEFSDDNLDKKTVAWAKETFFKAGLTKDQAKAVEGSWNGYVKSMVDAELETRQKERETAEAKLKSELGDKYDASIELVRRFWKKHTNDELDTFVNETKIGNDPRLIRLLVSIAKSTGEDTSPAGSPSRQQSGRGGIVYDKSPEPRSIG